MKLKLKEYYDTINKKITPYKKNIIFPIIKILLIIIVCAILVRVMSGNETLLEYAAKNAPMN